MDKPTRNFLGMVRTVNGVFATKPATLTLSVPLTNAFGSLATLYGQARVFARQTRPINEGISPDKETKLQAACQAVRYVFDAMGPWALSTGNAVLAALASPSLSDLVRVPDNEIIPILEEGVAKAREHLVALAPYGVTSAELDATDDLIDTADDAIGNPRNAIVDRSTAVTLLGQRAGQMRTLLEGQIDPQVNRLKMPGASGEATTFALDYDGARIIVNLGEGGADDADPAPAPVNP